MNKLVILFSILFFTSNSFAVTELDTEFGYSKTSFGEDKASSERNRSYSGSIAFYFLSMTAVEFNYYESENETTINYDLTGLSGTYIKNQYQSVKSSRYGVGLRQSLAGKNSFLQPSLSLGWARQKNTSYTNYKLITLPSNVTATVTGAPSKNEYDSIFAAFALKIKLTRFLSLKGSVRTYFQAFEWNEAKDQLSYTAGLSWLF